MELNPKSKEELIAEIEHKIQDDPYVLILSLVNRIIELGEPLETETGIIGLSEATENITARRFVS